MRLRLSVLSSLLLASLSAQADPGRIQVSAMQSNTSIFGADGMLPLLGNNQQFFYGDLMGDYGTDDTYLMSPGLGYRAVVNNQIWGGYVFSDYERTSLGGNFWVISPGVEWMSSNWDAHLNGYFPTQSQQQNGSRAYADTFGIYQYGNPHDYQYDDAYLTPYAVIGNGVDTEVGYSFAQEDHLRSRVSLGGYYYHPQEAYDVSNITGITASFTKSLSKNFSASLLNSYDNFNHYILGVSLTLEFGGDSNEFSTDVSDRLLDPVERHIGIIGTGAGTYDQQNYQVTGYGTEYYPVLYTEPHGTGDGSAKNPAGLTSDNLALFNEMFPGGSMIFVQGGGNANYYLTDPLVINDGQNIYGRTEDYKAPAVRDKQPQIIAASGSDGLDITDATSTISDVSILGQGETHSASGIAIWGNSDVTLSNVNISKFAGGGAYGVYVYNTADLLKLTILNSSFDGNYNGVYAENVGSGDLIVSMAHSTANYVTNDGLIFLNNTSSGTGNATLTVKDSQFLNTGTSSGNDGIFIANGSDGRLTATIENSELSGNRSNGLEIANNTNAGGGEGSGTGFGVLTVTVNNSTINNNGYYLDGPGPGVGVTNYGRGITNVNIYNSTISNNNVNGVSVENTPSEYNTQSMMDVNVIDTTFRGNGGVDIYGSAYTGTSTLIAYTNPHPYGYTSTNQSGGDNITWISE